MDERFEALARDEADVTAARAAIWSALDIADGHRVAYAALCKWTWRAMIERRLDDDMRSWHRLLLDAAGRMALEAGAAKPSGRRLTPIAVAERLKGFAELVRMSVDAAEASPTKDLTARAHVLEILRFLAGKHGEYVERDHIKVEVGLKDANLSRVLTLLAANGLIERQPRGKVASFRATQRALNVVATSGALERKRARSEMAPPPAPGRRIISEREGVKLFTRAFQEVAPKRREAEIYDPPKILVAEMFEQPMRGPMLAEA